MNNLKDCCHYYTSDKVKVLSENGMKFIIENKSDVNYCIVIVDGCQIDDDGDRCDYAAIIDTVEYFIELKGSDINKAIKQLESTIKRLSEGVKKNKKKSFVVSSRCPLSSSRIQVIRKKMKKTYNSTFEVKNRVFKEII